MKPITKARIIPSTLNPCVPSIRGPGLENFRQTLHLSGFEPGEDVVVLTIEDFKDCLKKCNCVDSEFTDKLGFDQCNKCLGLL